MHNRELAQKPREPHAAFGHCAKPRAEMKFDVTENQVNGRVVGSKDKYWWVKNSHLCLNCWAQDAKSVGSLSGSDSRKNGSQVAHRPDTHLDEYSTASETVLARQ
jgi:hypothetical protein